MFLRKTEHNIPEKRYPHTEGDFSLAGLSFREKIRKMRQDPRGIEIGQLIWIVVGVLAASALGVFIFNQVTDTGGTIEEAGGTDIATYSADCDGQTVARIWDLGDPAAGTTERIRIPHEDDAAGYRQPATVGFTSNAAPGGTGGGILSVSGGSTNAEIVGFIRSVDVLTEASFNADFDGNNRIDAGEVVAVLATGVINLDTTNTASIAGTEIRVAHAGDANIPINDGAEIVVNRLDACWGVKLA